MGARDRQELEAVWSQLGRQEWPGHPWGSAAPDERQRRMPLAAGLRAWPGDGRPACRLGPGDPMGCRKGVAGGADLGKVRGRGLVRQPFTSWRSSIDPRATTRGSWTGYARCGSRPMLGESGPGKTTCTGTTSPRVWSSRSSSTVMGSCTCRGGHRLDAARWCPEKTMSLGPTGWCSMCQPGCSSWSLRWSTRCGRGRETPGWTGWTAFCCRWPRGSMRYRRSSLP